MSISTSEPILTPGTSSGLSPKALHDRHAARQPAKHEDQHLDRRPALRRLRRLSDLQGARQVMLPRPEEPKAASSGRDPASRPQTADPGATAKPRTSANPQASGAVPSSQHAPSAKALPRSADQKGPPAKHRQRADAPRHLAEPLSSKPIVPRKRNVSEVLNLFKGKVSQALAQRKHLKPARLDIGSGPQLQDRAMRRQLGSQRERDAANGRTAAADACALHARKQNERKHAQHSSLKAEALRERRQNPQDNSQDPDLQTEVPHGLEEVAEVDQPARCKAQGNNHRNGAGQQGTAKGAAQTCASIAQHSPVKQGPPQGPVQMPAVPPEKYAHLLKSFLFQRFCEASGLSSDQARHPETLQQGIASLVSALDCNKSSMAAGCARNDMQHAGKGAVRRPAADANKSSAVTGCKITDKRPASKGATRMPAAGSKTFQHVSAPSMLYQSRSKQQLHKSAPPALSKGGTLNELLFRSSDPAGLQEDKGLLQGMGATAYPWRQQGDNQNAFRGVQGVSLSLAEDDSEADLPDVAASDLGPHDCLDSWMDSIHSPEPSLDRVHRKDDRCSMHSMPSASPDLLLTEDADVAGMSPDAHTLGVLPSSPKLADAFQQFAADSLQEKLLKTNDFSGAEVGQACANGMGAAPAGDSFLRLLSKGAEAELEATEMPDLRPPNMHRDSNGDAYGLGGDDAAWLHDPADLQDDSSELISDIDALADKDVDELYSRARSGQLHVRSNSRSRQHTWLEADPDPVAAFSGFCESLAM